MKIHQDFKVDMSADEIAAALKPVDASMFTLIRARFDRIWTYGLHPMLNSVFPGWENCSDARRNAIASACFNSYLVGLGVRKPSEAAPEAAPSDQKPS